MYFELKENKPHGTKDDPFSTYHIKNEGRSFQIPVHWHDEPGNYICKKVDYFTFLFPLEYISFCTDDMLDDKLLTPLKNGHLMIRPRMQQKSCVSSWPKYIWQKMMKRSWK